MTEKTQEREVDTIVETRTGKPKAEKREVISISVTPEEKRRISVEALKDYSTTVSDLIRSRMFVKVEDTGQTDKEPKSENAEIEIYEEVIQQLKSEISDLKDKNLSLKLQFSENENPVLDPEEPTVKKENVLLLEFNDVEGESIIQKIRTFRSELFEKAEPENVLEVYELEQFAKLLLFRGLRRSYNNGILNESTGLRISEVQQFVEQEGFDYSDEV